MIHLQSSYKTWTYELYELLWIRSFADCCPNKGKPWAIGYSSLYWNCWYNNMWTWTKHNPLSVQDKTNQPMNETITILHTVNPSAHVTKEKMPSAALPPYNDPFNVWDCQTCGSKAFLCPPRMRWIVSHGMLIVGHGQRCRHSNLRVWCSQSSH